MKKIIIKYIQENEEKEEKDLNNKKNLGDRKDF